MENGCIHGSYIHVSMDIRIGKKRLYRIVFILLALVRMQTNKRRAEEDLSTPSSKKIACETELNDMYEKASSLENSMRALHSALAKADPNEVIHLDIDAIEDTFREKMRCFNFKRERKQLENIRRNRVTSVVSKIRGGKHLFQKTILIFFPLLETYLLGFNLALKAFEGVERLVETCSSCKLREWEVPVGYMDKLVGCGHSMCVTCRYKLEYMLSGERNVKVDCPTCKRTTWRWLSSLRPSSTLRERSPSPTRRRSPSPPTTPKRRTRSPSPRVCRSPSHRTTSPDYSPTSPAYDPTR